MTNNFFNLMRQKTESRITPTKNSSKFLLDKNEQSNDVDLHLKMQIVNSLLQANWNRYPAADYKDIETKVAEYCGVKPENIVLSAGSASIITTLLDFFALNKKNITIAQPTYSLFDYHCKTYNINYTPWYLNSELEYDFENLPELNSNSVLIVTSPNNPVGNSMTREQLEYLLCRFPKSLIILDGVYTEFANEDFTPLIREYENLVVLRSFSKAFPIAGLRLGYLCAAPQTASVIKKLILQFSITHFSLIFAKELLFNPAFIESSKKHVREIISERERIYHAINSSYDCETLHVYKSQGNFLLVKVADDYTFETLLSGLSKSGIKVLNTSPFLLLKNTFRVSVGNPNENEAFLDCLFHTVETNVFAFARTA